MDKVNFWDTFRGTYQLFNFMNLGFEEQFRRSVLLTSLMITGWTTPLERCTRTSAIENGSDIEFSIEFYKSTSLVMPSGYSITIPTGTYSHTIAGSAGNDVSAWIVPDKVRYPLLDLIDTCATSAIDAYSISAFIPPTGAPDNYVSGVPYLSDLIEEGEFWEVLRFGISTPSSTSARYEYDYENDSISGRQEIPFDSNLQLLFTWETATSSFTITSGNILTFGAASSTPTGLLPYGDPTSANNVEKYLADTVINHNNILEINMPFGKSSTYGLEAAMPEGSILFTNQDFTNTYLNAGNFYLVGTWLPSSYNETSSSPSGFPIGLTHYSYLSGNDIVLFSWTSGISASSTNPTIAVNKFDILTSGILNILDPFDYGGQLTDTNNISLLYKDNYVGILYNDLLTLYPTNSGSTATSAYQYTLTGHEGGYAAFVNHPTSGIYVYGGENSSANAGTNISRLNETLSAWPSGGIFESVGTIIGSPQNIIADYVSGGFSSGIYAIPFLPVSDIPTASSAITGSAIVLTTKTDFDDGLGYDAGLWFALGIVGSNFTYSTVTSVELNTWTYYSFDPQRHTYGLIYSSTLNEFIGVGEQQSISTYSSDGHSQTSFNQNLWGGINNYYDIAIDDNYLVVAGANNVFWCPLSASPLCGEAVIGPDGSYPKRAAATDQRGRWVVGGYVDNPILHNAIYWTDNPSGGIGEWTRPDWVTSMSWGSYVFSITTDKNDQWIAVQNEGYILRSEDNAVSWTESSGLATSSLNAIEWDHGIYIAGGAGNSTTHQPYIITSPDGINWTQRYHTITAGSGSAQLSGLANSSIKDIKYANNYWVALISNVSGSMVIYSNDDGVTWIDSEPFPDNPVGGWTDDRAIAYRSSLPIKTNIDITSYPGNIILAANEGTSSETTSARTAYTQTHLGREGYNSGTSAGDAIDQSSINSYFLANNNDEYYMTHLYGNLRDKQHIVELENSFSAVSGQLIDSPYVPILGVKFNFRMCDAYWEDNTEPAMVITYNGIKYAGDPTYPPVYGMPPDYGDTLPSFPTFATSSWTGTVTPEGDIWTLDNLSKLTTVGLVEKNESITVSEIYTTLITALFYSTGTIVLDISAGSGSNKQWNYSDSRPVGTSISYLLCGSNDSTFSSAASSWTDPPQGQSVNGYDYYRVTATLSGNTSATPVIDEISIRDSGITSRLTKGLNQFLKISTDGISTNKFFPAITIFGNLNNLNNLYGYGSVASWKHLMFYVGEYSNLYQENKISVYDTINNTWFDFNDDSANIVEIAGISNNIISIVNDTLYIFNTTSQTIKKIELSEPLIAYMKKRA